LKIGLPQVTSYIYPMSISWRLSFLGANGAAWDQPPPDIRDTLQSGIRKLALPIWDSANQETASGFACDIGSNACVDGKIFHMNLVPIKPEDETQRELLLSKSILPRWIQRYGNDCLAAWNQTLGTAVGIQAPAE
jgi:hypothetical protein